MKTKAENQDFLTDLFRCCVVQVMLEDGCSAQEALDYVKKLEKKSKEKCKD